ncbi:MAG TPA: GNAT family N-acetyltransferase [Bacteroidota bacterium]|nr:GNAT family N-acetyltransferase [Bacteroidota bacterium]
MNELLAIARHRDCCKVTLEVRVDNDAAQSLYQKFGFCDTPPPMHFWTHHLNPL